MKITFINPKITQTIAMRGIDVPPKIKEILKKNPKLQERLDLSQKSLNALGLLTVAGAVPKGFEIEFFDENWETIDYEREFDLVALGGNISQMSRMLVISSILKRRSIPLVAGGPAVMTYTDQFIKRKIPVVIGEGEALLKRFLADFSDNRTKKVYDKTDAPDHLDLTQAPIPRYDLASKYDYPMVGVQVSRGCPYNCSFCQVSRIYGDKYRHKPVENVIKEIKMVKEYWPDKFFFFYDDNPFFNRRFAVELFTRLKKEKKALGRWGANANVTLYKDEELLKLLATQGPVPFLGVGFESLSKNNLDKIDNKMKLNHMQEYEKAIEVFKKNNINPVGYFMFGFEDSKKEELDTIADFCRKNDIDGALTRLTPVPGTKLYERLKAEYEQKYKKINKSSIGEWGVIKNYLNEKIGIDEDTMLDYLADAFAVLFADENFSHSGGFAPFYFLY